MSKPLAADDVLQELWLIKAQTAERYSGAAEYFLHLGLTSSPNVLPLPMQRKQSTLSANRSSALASKNSCLDSLYSDF